MNSSRSTSSLVDAPEPECATEPDILSHHSSLAAVFALSALCLRLFSAAGVYPDPVGASLRPSALNLSSWFCLFQLFNLELFDFFPTSPPLARSSRATRGPGKPGFGSLGWGSEGSWLSTLPGSMRLPRPSLPLFPFSLFQFPSFHIMKAHQISLLAFPMLRHLEQVQHPQKSRLSRQLRSNVRKPNRLDRIHFNLAFFHGIPPAHSHPRPHPEPHAARNPTAPNPLPEPLRKRHAQSLPPLSVSDEGEEQYPAKDWVRVVDAATARQL
jgi:hypothetical protein